MTIIGSRPHAALLALHTLTMGALMAPAPALAIQILDAADHAELAARTTSRIDLLSRVSYSAA